MKLSNKILLAFVGLIFLYLTAAFAEIRFRGTPNIINNTNSIAEKVSLSGITHLRISGIDKEAINVIGSDRQELEVLSLSGDALRKLTYNISGNTLTLSGLQSDDMKRIRISVFVSSTSFRGISVDHSIANVTGLHPELMNIAQKSSRIWMSGCSIEKMNLDLSESLLEVSDTDVDSLFAQTERSRVNIYSEVGVVQGFITDGTLLNITDIEDIQLKKDKTSRLTIIQ